MPTPNTAPTVLSLTRSDPSTTNASIVHYTVTFSKPVTGVNAGDFSLTTAGLSGASVASVTPVAGGDGSQYTVAINTGSGNGTVTLDLTGASIYDLDGNPLPGGNFPTVQPVGAGAVIAIGDVNGDGKPDLVSGIDSSGILSVRLSNGDGTFGSATTYSVPGHFDEIALADLNGDNKPDIVVADGLGVDAISVLLNDGSGGFAPQASYATGPEPSGVALGDLDGDGRPDIVTTNQSGSTISVFHNNGDGTFAPQVTYSVPFGPVGVAIADVNGDGESDLVVGIDHGSSVSILLGNGDGTFQPQSSYAAGANPLSLKIADLNGDGRPDIVVTDQGTGTISVLLDRGDGSYDAPTQYAFSALGIALSDVNEDGKVDLVFGNYTENAVQVALGNGDGTFQSSIAFPAAGAGRIAVADLNGDGRPDVVVNDLFTNTLSVMLNTPATITGPTYTIDTIPPTGGTPDLIAASDSGLPTDNITSIINPTYRVSLDPSVAIGDTVELLLGGAPLTHPVTHAISAGDVSTGSVNLTVAAGDLGLDGGKSISARFSDPAGNTSTTAALAVTLDTVAPTFALSATVYSSGINSTYVAIGDLNGDGMPDLAVSDFYAGVTIWLNQGYGTFVQTSSYSASSAQDLSLVDVNGDGKLDLVVEDTYSNSVGVYLANGNGTFQSPVNVPAGSVVTSIKVADVNDDGIPDLISASYYDNQVSVSFGIGDGTFAARTAYNVGITPYGLAIGDLGNGHQDIVAANIGSSTLSVLTGDGTGTFTVSATLPTNTPSFVSLANFGNGHEDIITGNRDTGTVSVFLGDGTGAFQPAEIYAVGPGPYDVTVADFDGDGRLDIISSVSGSPSVSVLLGNGDGTFQPSIAVLAGIPQFTVAAADLNGDGRADIVAGSGSGFSVILNNTFLSLDPTTDSGAKGDGITNSPQVTIDGNTEANALVSLYEGTTLLGTGASDGTGAFSILASGLANGTHEITATATDTAGNTGSTLSALAVRVDATPPTFSTVAFSGAGITAGTGDIGAGHAVTMTVIMSEAVNVTGTPTLALNDGGTASYTGGTGTNTLSFTYNVMAGQNTAALALAPTGALGLTGGATIADLAGNAVTAATANGLTPAIGTLQIDTTAPTLTIGTIAGDDIINAGEAAAGFTISGTASDGGNGINGRIATIRIVNNLSVVQDTYAAVVSSGAWSVNVTATQAQGLADGLYTVRADISDAAGNSAAQTVHTATVDETAPAAPAITGAMTASTAAPASITLGGTGEPNAIISLLVNGLPTGTPVVADGAGSWSISPAAFASSSYFYTLTTTATDAAGNVSTVSAPLGLYVGTSAANNATGTQYNDLILGLAGADTLFGGAGNDTIDGGAGPDSMSGGVGDDKYIVDNTGDVVIENVNEGNDTILSSVTYTLPANVEKLTLTGTGNINGTGSASGGNVIIGNSGNNTLSDNGAVASDTFAGGLGNDTYVVSNASDIVVEKSGEGTDTVRSSLNYTLGANLENLILTGTDDLTGTGNAAGGNVITGNSGNNILTDGGALALGDTMVGGAGNDTYVVANASDVITETSGAGTDTVRTTLNTYTLPANVEILTFTGTGDFAGTGNNLANVITGGSGNDTLDGGTGADTQIGGNGNDTYLVDNTNDVVVENPNEGTDTIQSSVTYTLPANVENLTLTGTGNINGTGSAAGGNAITGNSGNNTLSDNGATAGDTFAGGLGNDTYVVSNASDIVIENSGEGTDNIFTTLNSYTLSANVENLTFNGTGDFSGIGNNLANKITGGAGNDTLDGGAGADTMVGGAGNDTYFVDNTGDVVTEAANAGTDTVDVTTISAYTLTINVENLTFLGNTNFNGTGNGLDNVISGGSGNDTLSGGAGNDTLIGGAGADVLTGGTGSDDFVFNAGDALGDLITDFTTNASQTDHIDFLGYTGDHLVKVGTSYQIQDAGNSVVGSFTMGNNSTLVAANYTFH